MSVCMTGPERTRHGLRALRGRVKLRGLGAIDRRSAAGKALLAARRELLAGYGGEAAGPEVQTMVDAVVRARLMLDHVDAYVFELASLVSKGRIKPVVAQRLKLAAVLDRALERLATHPAAIAARAQALEAAEQAAFEARHPR